MRVRRRHYRGAQLIVCLAHVDNPVGGVKFRRAIWPPPVLHRDPVQIRQRLMRSVGVRKDVNAG
jgi:hypothetical protein